MLSLIAALGDVVCDSGQRAASEEEMLVFQGLCLLLPS